MVTYQLTAAGIGLSTAGMIIYLVRKDLLHTRYSPFWLLTAFIITIFGLFPKLSDQLASLVGVDYAPTLILIIGILVLAIKALSMDIERSRLERQLRRLAQRLAILEAERRRTLKS